MTTEEQTVGSLKGSHHDQTAACSALPSTQVLHLIASSGAQRKWRRNQSTLGAGLPRGTDCLWWSKRSLIRCLRFLGNFHSGHGGFISGEIYAPKKIVNRFAQVLAWLCNQICAIFLRSGLCQNLIHHVRLASVRIYFSSIMTLCPISLVRFCPDITVLADWA